MLAEDVVEVAVVVVVCGVVALEREQILYEMYPQTKTAQAKNKKQKQRKSPK